MFPYVFSYILPLIKIDQSSRKSPILRRVLNKNVLLLEAQQHRWAVSASSLSQSVPPCPISPLLR